MPVAEVFEGFCLVIAGALLLTPGFVTDAAGALLLLPPVRALFYARVRHRLEAQLRPGAPPHRDAGRPDGRDPPSPSRPPPVIDAEYDEVETGEMPPPRGSWKPGP